MAEETIPDYPESDGRSFGYEVARTTIDAATSIIPGGSYAVGKLVEHFVAAPLQKRRDEWFGRIGAGLRELEKRFEGFEPARLSENEDFVSSVFEATQAAMKTSRQEKLDALRNVVMNIALGQTIDEVLRGSFFSYLDRFTPMHLRVLELLSNPSASPEMVEFAKNSYAASQMTGLQKALPTNLIDTTALKRILSELEREGLAETSGLMAMGTPQGLLTKRSTEAGDMFLNFTSSPADPRENNER